MQKKPTISTVWTRGVNKLSAKWVQADQSSTADGSRNDTRLRITLRVKGIKLRAMGTVDIESNSVSKPVGQINPRKDRKQQQSSPSLVLYDGSRRKIVQIADAAGLREHDSAYIDSWHYCLLLAKLGVHMQRKPYILVQ